MNDARTFQSKFSRKTTNNQYSSYTLSKNEIRYEEFEKTINEILEDPQTHQTTDLYTEGIELVLCDEFTILQKEKILSWLIFFFPNNSELYYYMGYTIKDTKYEQALMWFRIGFQICSIYIENTLDLMKLILEKKSGRGYAKKILEESILKPYIIPGEPINLYQIREKLKSPFDDIRFHMLLGTVYYTEDTKYECIAYFESLLCDIDKLKYILNDPTSFYNTIYFNLSDLYCEVMRMDKSLYCLNKIIETNTDGAIMRKVLNSYMLKCDYVYTNNYRRHNLCKKLTEFYNRTPEMITQMEKEIAEDYKYEGVMPMVPKPPNKITIGYLSNSIFIHAVSNFIFPIWKYHDKSKFRIIIFTQFSMATTDNFYQMFRDMGIEIVDLSYKGEKNMLKILRSYAVDIMIDLDGYEKGGMMEIMAYRIAPVQITYLGYPNTTGLDYIDYRIVDYITDPDNSIQLYSEKRLYMPRCFLLFESVLQSEPINLRFLSENTQPTAPLPTVILGALNKEPKNSAETLETWREILKAAPNTKIFIKSEDNYIERRRDFYLEKLGITSDRLILQSFCTSLEYIELFYKIDILLDPFPYSGTTTSCNTLYNSIPVITLYNKDYHAHNVTASLLINSDRAAEEELGVPMEPKMADLVAYSNKDYISKTVDLCLHPQKINDYKRTIHGKFQALMNPQKFMKDYEDIITNITPFRIQNAQHWPTVLTQPRP